MEMEELKSRVKEKIKDYYPDATIEEEDDAILIKRGKYTGRI